jgi:hypothetical protein
LLKLKFENAQQAEIRKFENARSPGLNANNCKEFAKSQSSILPRRSAHLSRVISFIVNQRWGRL